MTPETRARMKAGLRPDLATRAEMAEAEVARLNGIEAAAKAAADIYEAEIERLRGLLKAARKHVDPVIQYRLIEAIDAALTSAE